MTTMNNNQIIDSKEKIIDKTFVYLINQLKTKLY